MMRDKAGRPIVVVTGMGIVTSLGAGKADNWNRLVAGESGIRAITRFATDSLKTRVAGTVDFVPIETYTSADLSERLAELAIEEAIAEARIGVAHAVFPGRCFSRLRRSRSTGRSASCSPRIRAPTDTVSYDDLLRAASSGRYRAYHARFLFGSVGEATGRDVRHRRLADLAVDRLRLGRERDPARTRSDPARGNRRRAVRCDRRLGQPGKPDPVLAPLRALGPERAAAGGRKAVLQEPRRLRHGRGRRRAGAGELRRAPWRAGPASSASSPVAASLPTASIAPDRARTASRSSAA